MSSGLAYEARWAYGARMIRLSDLVLPLDHSPHDLDRAVRERLGLAGDAALSLHVVRRGNDARKKSAIKLVYTLDVDLAGEAEVLARLSADSHVRAAPDTTYRFPVMAPADYAGPRPVVIGAGPCGLLAALVLAQMGLRPIILERGKAVRERTKDTWGLWRRGVLDPESNVQYGEGGAGTFSDGKLYSRIKDPRHLGRKVLVEFVKAGAPDDILYEAHPHIGTFRLVTMVMSMRETIEKLGGEYRFGTLVSGFDVRDGALRGLHLGDGGYIETSHVIMAVGHSARDTFHALHDAGVTMEAKPFAIGVRIEHPQSWIDKARFGLCAGNDILGPAAYSLSHQASNGRTVYSFCMCPGGRVVAAASEEGRVVTNGMSQYSRNERNANAGIVVGIDPRDYPGWEAGDALAGIALQRRLESHAFVLGGGNYNAPAQLVGDFVAGRASTALGSITPSYKPGVAIGDLSSALPGYAIEAMREAFPVFGKKIKGFDTHDAVLTGVETRTSSPIKISRGEDLQSINVRGLYPAGEGASYAGGILSAGVDGIRVAEALARSVLQNAGQQRMAA